MLSNTLTKAAGLCFALALVLSCGPKKKTVTSGDNETQMWGAKKVAVLDGVAQQQLRYTTFSGRAKSNITINGKERYDVTANVRVVRDKAIWISVTAIMGIEVARVFITPDSIKIINRLQSEYTNKPFAYLRKFTGGGLDFSSLERLLVGDVIDPITADDSRVWQRTNGYLLRKQTNDLQYAVRVDTAYQNNYSSIVAPVGGQQLEAFYADYQPVAGTSFPHQVKISIVTPQLALLSEMRYSKVVYDEKIELPFTAPSRYTEVQ